jgi:hypothetical protein
MANLPGTAEHEHKRDFQREAGTGLTQPAYGGRDDYDITDRGRVGNMPPSAADPFGPTDRGPGNVPSTGAVEHGQKTENRATISDKIAGATEKALGKVMNKPAMVEKGAERQVSQHQYAVDVGTSS